jgi:hypothetical protein
MKTVLRGRGRAVAVLAVGFAFGGAAGCSSEGDGDKGTPSAAGGAVGVPNGGGGTTSASGGSVTTGGTSPSAGGVPASGVAPAAGGVPAAGGAQTTGGTQAAGGTGGGQVTGGAGGAATTGGAAGAGGMTECPPAPAEATAAQVAALNEINRVRLAAGAGCATEVTGANASATSHCAYYAANSASMMCIADPHAEVMSCTGFTGASFSARMKAGGYTGQPSFEVMAFSNDPLKAIAQWLNSVWHRIPIVSPWVTEFGYGSAMRCDTIDFGQGKAMPNTTVVVYPYDGQIDVPTTFDGSREGPMPPAPSSGWPSGSPVTLYAKMLTVTLHELTVDGQTTPIDHVFLTSADSSFLRDSVMMYANKPLTAATRYHVKITGTSTGGPLSREWSFTTK